jgi:hypothetical protein
MHNSSLSELSAKPYYINAQGLTHISPYLVFLAIISDIGYEVHRYITTGQLPYEE